MCVLKNDRHSRGYSGFLLVLHRVSLLTYVSKRPAIFLCPHLSGHPSGRFRAVLSNRHASETPGSEMGQFYQIHSSIYGTYGSVP